MVNEIVYDENGVRSILIPDDAVNIIKNYQRYVFPVNFADPNTGKPTPHYVINISTLDKALNALKTVSKRDENDDKEESFWDRML